MRPGLSATYSMGFADAFGMPLLNTVAAPRYVWTLCRIGSLFLPVIFWPTTAAWTRGLYMQFCWPTMMGGASAAALESGAPFTTCTQTLTSFWSFTMTASSVIGVLPQNGSESRFSFSIAGGVPVNSTAPLTVSAADRVGSASAARAAASGVFQVFMRALFSWDVVGETADGSRVRRPPPVAV